MSLLPLTRPGAVPRAARRRTPTQLNPNPPRRPPSRCLLTWGRQASPRFGYPQGGRKVGDSTDACTTGVTHRRSRRETEVIRRRGYTDVGEKKSTPGSDLCLEWGLGPPKVEFYELAYVDVSGTKERRVRGPPLLQPQSVGEGVSGHLDSRGLTVSAEGGENGCLRVWSRTDLSRASTSGSGYQGVAVGGVEVQGTPVTMSVGHRVSELWGLFLERDGVRTGGRREGSASRLSDVGTVRETFTSFCTPRGRTGEHLRPPTRYPDTPFETGRRHGIGSSWQM